MIFSRFSKGANNEIAKPIEWLPEWDAGAPIPYMISGTNKSILIYRIKEIDKEWDGTYVKVVSSGSNETEKLALVEFLGCYSAKFGGVNDEALSGHPLFEKGLKHYQAHIIENSNWILQEMKINSIHSNYSAKTWEDKNHYLLCFHDELFECIAREYQITIYKDTYRNVMNEAIKRIV